LGITAAVIVGSWLLLIGLAKRLPPGILPDLAAFMPTASLPCGGCLQTHGVPRRAQIAVLFAELWLANPVPDS
jgi:hypothetical protein